MRKSKTSAIVAAIHRVHGSGAHKTAKDIIRASLIRDRYAARARMNEALRQTPFCAWFVYHDGPYIQGYNYGDARAIQVRWGAEVIAEFPIRK